MWTSYAELRAKVNYVDFVPGEPRTRYPPNPNIQQDAAEGLHMALDRNKHESPVADPSDAVLGRVFRESDVESESDGGGRDLSDEEGFDGETTHICEHEDP